MLTIILTSYNRPLFIRRTLDSLLAQTCPDWRVILMDDGSARETLDVIAEYTARDERISASARTVADSERANARYAVLINEVLPTLQSGIVGYLCDNVEYNPMLVERVLRFFSSHPEQFAGYVTHQRDMWTPDGCTRLGKASDFHHWDITPPNPGERLTGNVLGLLDHSQVFHRLPVSLRWDERPEAKSCGDGIFFSALSRKCGGIYAIDPHVPLTIEHLVK